VALKTNTSNNFTQECVDSPLIEEHKGGELHTSERVLL